MSYLDCPNCNERINVFGESHLDEVAKEFGIDTVCKLPIDPKLAELCDNGEIESFTEDNLHAIVKMLRGLIQPTCGI
jgi:hypothetical protein